MAKRPEKEFDGVITSYSKRVDPDNTEFTEYTIEYEYHNGERTIRGIDIFSVNTAHMEWANHGSLIGYPVLVTTPADLESTFKPGCPVTIRLDSSKRNATVDYQKHPHQIIEKKVIKECQSLRTSPKDTPNKAL